MFLVLGILMLIAWVLLATSAVFFAAWMKPTLPNGEWFQVHRALMIGSLFVGAAGFIFAFVAHAKNTAIPGLIGFDSKVSCHIFYSSLPHGPLTSLHLFRV